MGTVPNIPYNTPIIDQTTRVLTPIWASWFREVFSRIGGNSAPDNSDISTLSTDVDTLQSTVAEQGDEIDELNESVVNQNSLTQGRQL